MSPLEENFQQVMSGTRGHFCHRPQKMAEERVDDLHCHASLLRDQGESAIVVFKV
jgi:hypothetical protein